MARGDFNYISVQHQFTVSSTVFNADFPVEIGGGGVEVVDDAYLLITVHSVGKDTHTIVFNNKGTPINLPPAPQKSNAFLTYMERIDANVLHPGINHVQINRVGDDDFFVKDMVVHWREIPGKLGG